MKDTCGAKTKAGTPCKNAPVKGRTRCRLHGGATPRGMANPNTKHGKYSKYLPARLQAKYEEAESDGDLIALRSELALIDARVIDLVQRVDTGEAGDTWRKLGRAYDEMVRATKAKNTAGMRAALEQIGDLIDKGKDDYAAWDEVTNLLEQRRKLVETERKRLVEMEQMITSERAMMLVGAVAGVIKAHVSDPKQLAAISRDIGAILKRPDAE